MKGIIKSDSRGWRVLYTEHNPKIMVKQYNKSLPLHPDDLWAVDHTGQIMGIIQEVEFEMVEVLTDDITIYAKLINSKKEIQYTKEQIMEFARWLAKDWMSTWVKDKWMWEHMDGYKPESYKYHGEYYTEEELFDLFLKLKKDEIS